MNLQDPFNQTSFAKVEMNFCQKNNVNYVESVKYTLQQTPTYFISYDIDDFEFLAEALRILPDTIIQKIGLYVEEKPQYFNNASITLANKKEPEVNPQDPTDISRLAPIITLKLADGQFTPEIRERINDEGLSNVLLDLTNQLQEFHKAGFIVSFFDLENYLVYDHINKRYCLIAFPYLIIDDNQMFRGIRVSPDVSQATRSQINFKGSSKANDYLALLKNFLIWAHQREFQVCKDFYPQSLQLVLREYLHFDVQTQEVRIAYINNDCDCKRIDPFRFSCKHLIDPNVNIRQSLKLNGLFKTFTRMTKKLLVFDYEYTDLQRNSRSNLEKKNKILKKGVEGLLKDIKDYGENEIQPIQEKINQINQKYDLILKNSKKLDKEIQLKEKTNANEFKTKLDTYLYEYRQIVQEYITEKEKLRQY